MTNISENGGWVLFADCEVIYNGRASSRLQRGNYLIVYKPDRSLSIHGATLIQPRNYLASGTFIQCQNTLTFRCKQEQIEIIVSNFISFTPLTDWSDHKITICRTEKELALKIFNNWDDYFEDSDVELLHYEYPTPLGPIDVLGQSTSTDYIIEVKRKTASLKDVTQLRRYVEAMETPNRLIRGFIAAPKISKNADKYLEKHGLEYLYVDFD